MVPAYIALGSNLSDRQHQLDAARAFLGALGTVEACSPVMESEPWGFVSPHPFLNQVLLLQTPLSPTELLDATQDIERRMGRTQKSEAGCYHDRIIDIDLLFYDNLVMDTPRLVLPHPLLHERLFVLQPLAAIAPSLVHPRLGLTVTEMLKKIEKK